MEKEPKMSQSPEEILAEKKEQLNKSVELMLDGQRAEGIKEKLSPELDNLTSEELDYCLERIRYSDAQVHLRGPFASKAGEMLLEVETTLKEMEKALGPERARELRGLMIQSK